MNFFVSMIAMSAVFFLFMIGDVIMGQPSIMERLTLCAALLIVILLRVSRK